MRSNSAAIIGAGPAGLMAAEVLAAAGLRVTVYEQMPSAGRKFLLAGRGGLNLTHSEPFETFVARYGAATPLLREAIAAFPPARLRAWAEALGQETFVGSSGRVFPKAMKASPLLRAWLRRLAGMGVAFRLRHRWTGLSDGGLRFEGPDGASEVRADVTVLALGGASWPHLGSDGRWIPLLTEAGVTVTPLLPANCGFLVDWSEAFRARFEGQPLKGIALRVGDRTARGEAVVTRAGLEGGAIYAISAALRDALLRDGGAALDIALRPHLGEAELAARLGRPRGKQSLSSWLRKTLHLPPVAIGLLHEACAMSGTTLSSLEPPALAKLVNRLPLRIAGAASIARAISSAGGIARDEIDRNFMLRKLPGFFVAGEMLDWEAPTGGYLLQACFATGAAAGAGAAAWVNGAAERSR